MSNSDDISFNGGKRHLSEDKLMAYLEGRLSPEEQHEVELWLENEGMESDAVEGLMQIGAQETRHSVSRLNHKLRQQTSGKKRKRKYLKNDHWGWLAVAIILLLAILAYIAIRYSIKVK